MYKPSLYTANEQFFTYAAYLVARLQAAKQTKDLIPKIETPNDKLKAEVEHDNAVKESVVTAMALRDAKDTEADEFIRRVYQTVVLIGGGRYGGNLGKYFFPDGLSGIIHISLSDQISEMRILAARLRASENEELAALAQPVEEKANQLEAGAADYEEHVNLAAVSFGDVLAARTEWIRAYEKLYGELIARMGKSKAEKFFKKGPRRKKKTTNG